LIARGKERRESAESDEDGQRDDGAKERNFGRGETERERERERGRDIFVKISPRVVDR